MYSFPRLASTERVSKGEVAMDNENAINLLKQLRNSASELYLESNTEMGKVFNHPYALGMITAYDIAIQSLSNSEVK